MPHRRGEQHAALERTRASELERVVMKDLLEARDGVVLEKQRAIPRRVMSIGQFE